MKEEKEVWKQVPNTIYYASNLGRIKTLDRVVEIYSERYKKVLKVRLKKRIRKLHFDRKGGYLRTGTAKKKYKVHRLVALAFLPNPENKPEVNHIDGNKLNNNLSNLEWVTSKENVRHAVATGLRKPHNKTPREIVLKVREELSRKTPVKEIMSKFNISDATIWQIKYNRQRFE